MDELLQMCRTGHLSQIELSEALRGMVLTPLYNEFFHISVKDPDSYIVAWCLGFHCFRIYLDIVRSEQSYQHLIDDLVGYNFMNDCVGIAQPPSISDEKRNWILQASTAELINRLVELNDIIRSSDNYNPLNSVHENSGNHRYRRAVYLEIYKPQNQQPPAPEAASQPPSSYNQCYKDRVSNLPDDILVNIVSRLSLKEAGKTSIISSRWKKLWMFKTGDLDFTDPLPLSKLEQCFSLQLLQTERERYTNWVNHVLKSHQGAVVDGFKICFDFDESYDSHLDTWVESALRRKTLNLELDLKPNKRIQHNPYPFPESILTNLKSNIEILRSIRLCWVDVTAPVLQDILSICISLEAISISGSNTLLVARFCGPAKLKSVEIQHCKSLKTIEVSAESLESLVCCGEKDTSLAIHYAPKLHTVYVGGYYCLGQYPLFSDLYPMFSQIQKLVLDCTVLPFQSIWSDPVSNFPQLNLKWLELKLPSYDDQSLLYCITMIEACPVLHRFGVEFDWKMQRFGDKPRDMMKIKLEEKLECLKTVEFTWFAARISDIELVISVLDNALNVEAVIFDSHYPTVTSNRFAAEFDSDEDRMIARECARHLANNHCPYAQLIVH